MGSYLRLAVFIFAFSLANGAGRYSLAKTSPSRPEPGTNIPFKDVMSAEERVRQEVQCETLISQELRDEIAGYSSVANQIIAHIMSGPFKGKSYNEMVRLIDKYPIRLSGEQNLEDSIDHMMHIMSNAMSLENVRGEQVLVPHWIRGEESAVMLEPWKKNIRLLGLGTTVGTPEAGMSHEVIVVKNFEELEARQDEVRGKIVVYNQGWLGSYGATNVYRTQGATRASRFGAVASLIESVAPFSLDSPHTGGQSYAADVTHIPTACITKEDADLMYRLQSQGERIVIDLKMLDYNLPLTTSRNVIGEIVGSTKPEEYVAVSGHIDSWDVGQGAMDDAGGVMISVAALAAIKSLGLQPKRTLQAILWTSEEPGLWGVEDFARQHKDILANYSVVFESDSGTFKPLGLDFAGTDEAGCIVQEVLKLAAPLNATTYTKYDTVSSDITVLIAEGVPGLSLHNQNDMYFWYHHTEADTVSMQDPVEMDLDCALFAVTSYVLADISAKLPRAPAPAP